MENKVPLGEGFMYPDLKKYCFWKRSAAEVDIDYEGASDSFTFTPCFGDFKGEFEDLEKYLVEEYVKKYKLEWCDVEIEWLRHCHYEINPETKELGEFLESSGIEGVSWEWNKETQEFQDREEEEEEEDEEEDTPEERLQYLKKTLDEVLKEFAEGMVREEDRETNENYVQQLKDEIKALESTF
jgi:hypothetical protein